MVGVNDHTETESASDWIPPDLVSHPNEVIKTVRRAFVAALQFSDLHRDLRSATDDDDNTLLIATWLEHHEAYIRATDAFDWVNVDSLATIEREVVQRTDWSYSGQYAPHHSATTAAFSAAMTGRRWIRDTRMRALESIFRCCLKSSSLALIFDGINKANDLAIANTLRSLSHTQRFAFSAVDAWSKIERCGEWIEHLPIPAQQIQHGILLEQAKLEVVFAKTDVATEDSEVEPPEAEPPETATDDSGKGDIDWERVDRELPKASSKLHEVDSGIAQYETARNISWEKFGIDRDCLPQKRRPTHGGHPSPCKLLGFDEFGHFYRKKSVSGICHYLIESGRPKRFNVDDYRK